MEIINFSDTLFYNIPEQDNPVYDKHECILICQTESHAVKHNGAKYMVIHVIPVDHPYEGESVHQKGLFWYEEDAILFAEQYIKFKTNENDTP